MPGAPKSRGKGPGPSLSSPKRTISYGESRIGSVELSNMGRSIA